MTLYFNKVHNNITVLLYSPLWLYETTKILTRIKVINNLNFKFKKATNVLSILKPSVENLLKFTHN